VADLAVGPDVIRADQVARVDVRLLDELVDLYGARGFQRDLLEFLFRDLDELVLLELIPVCTEN